MMQRREPPIRATREVRGDDVRVQLGQASGSSDADT
jgi:hypothetical protein